MLSPSTPHLVMMWPFGKKGRQSLRLGISNSCLFTPTIISVIPPKPLFSLLTNIPQVTFPICLNSDSLTGVSAGNLDNSQCGLIFTVRTDGENWDLEISLEYYDLAQSLGTRGSGRTDMLYLSWAFGSPWMLLTSFENPCSIGFAIHQHVSTTGIHVSPILNPPPSYLLVPSLWVIPVHQPQASSIMHWTWAGDSFHIWYYTCFNAILPNHPTLSLSHRVQKTVLYICVSFAVSHTGLSLPSF